MLFVLYIAGTDKASRTNEVTRSESPFIGSDSGMQSDDTNPSPAKGKAKPKGKRAGERSVMFHCRRSHSIWRVR